VEDGKLFYERRWFRRGQSVQVPISPKVTNIGLQILLITNILLQILVIINIALQILVITNIALQILGYKYL
jgi:hypothetical protein